MKTYPLHSISLEQAKQLQFKVIDAVTRNFQGEEVLSLGDLGVVKGLNKPRCTVKVEKVFADTFDAPAALLVRGSGTGAIRWALTACLKPGDAILVHTSPIYTTTQVTIDAMGLKPIRADFNDLEQLKAVCAQHKDEIRGALVQLTRQKPEDRYDYKAVIAAIKAALPGIPVTSGGNYTDENGQQWVCDEVDLARGVYVQRVAKFKLTSSMKWMKTGTNVDRYFCTFDGIDAAGTFCTHFSAAINSETVGGIATSNSNIIGFAYAESGTTTVDDFKAFLDANEVYIYVPLATAIKTALSSAAIATYKALTTYAPTTVISASGVSGLAATYSHRKAAE